LNVLELVPHDAECRIDQELLASEALRERYSGWGCDAKFMFEVPDQTAGASVASPYRLHRITSNRQCWVGESLIAAGDPTSLQFPK
jgi:hypothetical protein